MCGMLFRWIVLTFPLLLHLNGLYSRLIYRCFYYVTRLMFILGYYQRHSWPYNPVHTCTSILNSMSCMFPCVRINDDDDSDRTMQFTQFSSKLGQCLVELEPSCTTINEMRLKCLNVHFRWRLKVARCTVCAQMNFRPKVNLHIVYNYTLWSKNVVFLLCLYRLLAV